MASTTYSLGYLGDMPYGGTFPVVFGAVAAAGTAITITGFLVSDIEIYKGTSMTQRASDSGYTLLDTDGIDVDGVTGFHGFTVDTSDNTTAGFWGPGNEYFGHVGPFTADSVTVLFTFSFSIENRPLAGLLLRTTIAVLTTQVAFTLTAGSVDDNAYNGCMVVVSDAASVVQKAVGVISDYVGSTKGITLLNDPAIFTMVATDYVAIYADRALKATVDNRTLDVDTGGGAEVGSLATQAKADVNAEVVDAIATDTYAEPAQGTPGATVSLTTKIGYLYKNFRNAKTQTATQWNLLNDDASTVDHKSAVSDNGTTVSKGEVATGP